MAGKGGKGGKGGKAVRVVKSVNPRDQPSPNQQELACNSQSEESTDSSRAESLPETESDQQLPSTVLPFSST